MAAPKTIKQRKSEWLPWAALLVLAAGWMVVLAEAGFAVVFAKTLYDEGGYLYEGWLVCARGWRPYQDFHTKVTPLLYYFYGLPQAALGPSLLLGRIQAAMTSLVALALGSWAIGKRYGIWASGIAVWLFAATIAGLDQYFRTLAIPPCALWVSMALVGIAHAERKWGVWVAGVGVGLLLLTRHDLLGMAIGLLIGVWLAGGWKGIGRALLAATATFGAGLAPFLARAPRAVLRVLTLGKLYGYPPLGPRPFARTEPLSLENLPWYAKYLVRAYFAPGLCLVVAGWGLIAERGRSASKEKGMTRQAVAIGALTAAVCNLAMRGMATALTGRNAFYLRDFYIELPLILAAAAFAALALERISERRGRRIVAGGVVAAIALGPIAFGPRRVFRIEKPPVLVTVAEAGRFIADHTRPDDRIFTIADPYIFLAAKREVLPRLTHHMFMYAPEAKTAAVRRTWCFNLETLMEMLRRDATAVVLTERGMRWLVHNERTTVGVEVDKAVREELEKNWRLVASAENSFVGRIEIYRRRE